MKNKVLGANLSMTVSKILSGLNMNALKYLLPVWLGAMTGTAVRCVFAAAAFWGISFWGKREADISTKEKGLLLGLGAVGLYGYMFFYLVGLSKTTPISSSIFTSLQPIWVFLIMIFFYKERATPVKVIGIGIGLAGALVCILSQKSDGLASNPLLGNALCLVSSVIYAVYLVISQRLLASVGPITMLKYTFSGAACSGLAVVGFTGIEAPILSVPLHALPLTVLLFVLVFPTVISYLLMLNGLKYLKTTVVAIYGYLILIVATLVSYLLGQDRFSWTQVSAIAFICVGVYLVEVAEGREGT
ncbi:MAG: DMT family transporter [Bacteroides sp.]